LRVDEPASRVVPGLRAREPYAAYLRLLAPVQGGDALDRNAPGPEVEVDAQRHHVPGPVGVLEHDDRWLVQVVVVVVADQHRVDGRDVLDLAGDRVEPLRAGPGGRRGTLAEDGIEQEPGPVDLHDGRRVAVPGRRQLAGLCGRLGGNERDDAD